MSKSWRRNSGWKDNSTWAKRQATKTVRRYPLDGLPPVGREYHKLYEQWNITDWNCTHTPEYQSWEWHNPHLSNYRCICDADDRFRWNSEIVKTPPAPIKVDGVNWVLPPEYAFTHRYMAPEQRVNPETGAYEHKVWLRRWVYRHDVAWQYSDRGPTRPSGCYYTDMDWYTEDYEAWVENPEPEVRRYYERPYFTDKDIREHVKERERDTRDYRHRNQWPRYWRRDRKRARHLKGTA